MDGSNLLPVDRRKIHLFSHTSGFTMGPRQYLVGLKDVIIGRLIPSKTGDVVVHVRRGPTWAVQSLTALVEADERDLEDSLGSLAFPSLADMAAEEGFDEEI